MDYLLRLDDDLGVQFRARVQREGRSMRWVLERLIARYLEGAPLDDALVQNTGAGSVDATGDAVTAQRPDPTP